MSVQWHHWGPIISKGSCLGGGVQIPGGCFHSHLTLGLQRINIYQYKCSLFYNTFEKILLKLRCTSISNSLILILLHDSIFLSLSLSVNVKLQISGVHRHEILFRSHKFFSLFSNWVDTRYSKSIWKSRTSSVKQNCSYMTFNSTIGRLWGTGLQMKLFSGSYWFVEHRFVEMTEFSISWVLLVGCLHHEQRGWHVFRQRFEG